MKQHLLLDAQLYRRHLQPETRLLEPGRILATGKRFPRERPQPGKQLSAALEACMHNSAGRTATWRASTLQLHAS